MIIEYKGKRPQIANNVYIAPTAVIIGDVIIKEGSNIWFGAVIRGDTGPIRIGSGVSIQDNAVIHVNENDDTIIGDNIVIGHGAILEGCQVDHGCLIGMNATVLSGSTVGANSVVAAGAVVRERFSAPPSSLLTGVPAKILRTITPSLQAHIAQTAHQYRQKAITYMHQAKII